MKNNKVDIAMEALRSGVSGDTRMEAHKVIKEALKPEEKKELRPTQEQLDKLYKYVEDFAKEQLTSEAEKKWEEREEKMAEREHLNNRFRDVWDTLRDRKIELNDLKSRIGGHAITLGILVVWNLVLTIVLFVNM